jgi:hypothetical protein
MHRDRLGCRPDATIGFVMPVQQSPTRVAAARRRIAVSLCCAGLVLQVTGTFLPWLQSGSVIRNSYQTVSIARRLTALGDGVLGAATAAWPAVGIGAALCVATYITGARRTGLVGVLLLSVVVGTVAALAMVLLPGSESTIRVIVVGPIVTLGGAVLALVGALTLFAWPRN